MKTFATISLTRGVARYISAAALVPMRTLPGHTVYFSWIVYGDSRLAEIYRYIQLLQWLDNSSGFLNRMSVVTSEILYNLAQGASVEKPIIPHARVGLGLSLPQRFPPTKL